MTGNKLLTYIYQRVKQLKDEGYLPIKGNVYKANERPLDAQTEDCCIAIIAGNASQIQEGEAVVNIYVQDVMNAEGLWKENRERTEAMEHILEGLPMLLTAMGDIHFTASGMILTLEEEDIHQHFASIKMSFKVLTEY
jgi:hypothetical protein